MARYISKNIDAQDGWYLLAPEGVWETIKMVYMALRHPKRCAILVRLSDDFTCANLRPPVRETEKQDPPANKQPQRLSDGQALIQSEGWTFKSHNHGEHLAINTAPVTDYWPSTGKFIQRVTMFRGKGVDQLRKHLRRQK